MLISCAVTAQLICAFVFAYEEIGCAMLPKDADKLQTVKTLIQALPSENLFFTVISEFAHGNGPAIYWRAFSHCQEMTCE